MTEKQFIGLIHWPRLWAGMPPSSLSGSGNYNHNEFDPATLRDVVWTGTIGRVEIPLKVYREGTFLFDLEGWKKGILSPIKFDPQAQSSLDIGDIGNLDEQRCELLNAYLYCLYSKLLSKQKKGVRKMLLIPNILIMESDGLINVKSDELTFHLASACYEGTYSSNFPKSFDFRANMHPGNYVSIETLNATAELFSQILDSDKSDELIRLCSLQLRAYVDAEQHQYRYSLSQAFMVTEFIIGELYSKKIPDGKPSDSIFLKNKKLIRSFQSLPICQLCISDIEAAKENCLSGNLTQTNVEKGELCLNRTRLIRNKWIHGHDTIELNEAIEAIRVSERLIKECYGIEIFSSVSQSARVW